MEQNNTATGLQEGGPVGAGGVYNHQGFDVVVGAGDGGTTAAAVGGAGGAGASIGVAIGSDGDVAVGGASGGAVDAVAGASSVDGGGASGGAVDAVAGASSIDGGGASGGAIDTVAGASSVDDGGASGGAVDGGASGGAVDAVAGASSVDGGTSAAAGDAVDGGGAGAAIGVGVGVGGDGDVAVGGGSGVNVAVAGPSREKQRHTQKQIKAMKAYFNEYPYPNKSKRNDLARSLGMDPAQVKFWFQNKRAQLRSQGERNEIETLRSENDMLRAKRKQLVETLCKKNACLENTLRLENIHLKNKTTPLLDSTISRYMAGQNLQNFPITFHNPRNPSTSKNQQNVSMIFHNSQNLPLAFQNPLNLPILFKNPQNLAIKPVQNPRSLPIISQNPQDLFIISPNPQNVPIKTEADNANSNPADIGLGDTSTRTTSSGEGINLISSVKTSDKSRQSIIELVVSAADELKVMAMAGGPLWISSSADGTNSMLNEVEYLAMFPSNFGPTRSGYTGEGSRHIAKVSLNPAQLLSILMNVNKWAVMFSAIVSSAMTMEVLSEGTDYNAAIQVMAVEYHIPTPLVPNRNTYVARYCKKVSEGVWAVVDVSVDNILPTQEIMTCQKKPSGCLIQEMSDGTSKITWIEHVHADYNGVSTMYKRLLLSGLGFGAKRWVSILERQCQLRMTAMSASVPSTHGFNNLSMSTPGGREGILKLAARLVKYFLFGITGPKTGRWTILPGKIGENIRLMSTRVMNDPGLPNGTVLSVATSFSLSVGPSMVFNFFNNHRSRKEWDIFATESDYEQVFHIPYGEEAGKCVSIYKVLMRRQGHMPEHMLLLEESWSDPLASHIVFAPAHIGDIDAILRGGNPNVIPVLPSGFTILPDGPTSPYCSRGTLLTVSFQVLMTESPDADIDPDDAAKVAQLLGHCCEKIKHALAAIAPNTLVKYV